MKKPEITSTPHVLPSTVNTLFKYIKDDIRKLGSDEHLELDWLSPIHHGPDDFVLAMAYWRKDRHGDIVRPSYRWHMITLSERTIERLSSRGFKNALVEYLYGWMRYLAILILPFRKPKGYQILHRKFVLVPAPKFRSRIRCRSLS